MDRRNFLTKTGMFTASSFLPIDIVTAISPTELPMPNFDGFLNANYMFHGNSFVVDSFTDLFNHVRAIYKFENVQKKCFVSNFRWMYFIYEIDKIKLVDAQIKTLGINPEDFYKVKSYLDKNVVIHKGVENSWCYLPFEKIEEFGNLPEYKNCCVEIPFEKMAKILGKDDSSCPLQFFAFNSSEEWHDYFDVFLESKGLKNFKNQTCKYLETIKFSYLYTKCNIDFLQKVRERLQLNQQVATHCPEVMSQINQLIKAIHVHVEDYKNFSNSNLQKKHFNQSDQDPDWYNDKTDIFAATKERFHE